jgi:hypothetical protein
MGDLPYQPPRAPLGRADLAVLEPRLALLPAERHLRILGLLMGVMGLGSGLGALGALGLAAASYSEGERQIPLFFVGWAALSALVALASAWQGRRLWRVERPAFALLVGLAVAQILTGSAFVCGPHYPALVIGYAGWAFYSRGGRALHTAEACALRARSPELQAQVPLWCWPLALALSWLWLFLPLIGRR